MKLCHKDVDAALRRKARHDDCQALTTLFREYLEYANIVELQGVTVDRMEIDSLRRRLSEWGWDNVLRDDGRIGYRKPADVLPPCKLCQLTEWVRGFKWL